MVQEIIPNNWTLKRLGDLTDVHRGASPRPKGDPRYFGGDISWIKISDVTSEPGKYLTKTVETVTQEGAKKSKLLPRGSLILSICATVCVPKILMIDGCIHDGFVYFSKLPEEFDKVFLYYYFEYIRPKVIQENRQGMTQVNLNTGIVSNFEIPVPPVSEQKRIVACIESLFTQLDAGVAGLKRTQAALKRYRASVLKAACEGRLVPQDPKEEPAKEILYRLGKSPLRGEFFFPLPNGWSWTQLGDLTSRVTSGSRGWAKYYTENGDLFLRVGNFNRLTTDIDLSEVVQVNAPNTAEGTRTRLELYDVLITITADVGMVGIVNEGVMQQWEKAYINQHVGLVRLTNTVLAIYVAWALASEYLQEQFIEKQYGATKKGLNLDDLKSLKIALPPLAEQSRIIVEVERRLSVVQELEHTVSNSLKRAERLRQAILKQGFEGRLVKQKPHSEKNEDWLDKKGEENGR